MLNIGFVPNFDDDCDTLLYWSSAVGTIESYGVCYEDAVKLGARIAERKENMQHYRQATDDALIGMPPTLSDDAEVKKNDVYKSVLPLLSACLILHYHNLYEGLLQDYDEVHQICVAMKYEYENLMVGRQIKTLVNSVASLDKQNTERKKAIRNRLRLGNLKWSENDKARWQQKAQDIWAINPNLSKSHVATRIARDDKAPANTIRRYIVKSK